MPTLAGISAVVTLHFPRITALGRFVYNSFVDRRPQLPASTALFGRFKHFDPLEYTFHCGKQLCPHLAVKCRRISAPFVLSDTTEKH